MNIKNKIVIVTFLLFISFFAIGSIIVKDREFSDMENRNLTMLPKLNKDALLSGDYMDEIEDYMADQIILKDALVSTDTTVGLLMNQRLQNGVYFASSGMLISEYVKSNQLTTNIDYVNQFANENSSFEVTWLVVPNASYVYEDKLPKFASPDSESEAIDTIKENTSSGINLIIPSEELLDAKEDYIFYKTDHHWTQDGAYIGYRALAEGMGLEVKSTSDYDINTPSFSFYGSLYSKVPSFTVKPDTITIYNNKTGLYTVDYIDSNFSQDSLYNYEKLMTKDQYQTYLDGNHSIIKISSNAENDEPVLVVKDSYAHALLPFLADNYSDITVVDLRYYHESVSQYAKDNNIKKIILINNIDFMTTDNNFLWLY